MIILMILTILLSNNHHIALANFTSTPQNTLRYNVKCTNNGKYKPNSLYQFSLYNLLGHLTSEASRSSFHKGSYGQRPHHVYALYVCRGDADSDACSGCVNAAKDTILEECPFQTGAMIWYPVCMVRFSNQSFFGQVDVVPRGLLQKPENVTRDQTARFARILGGTMNELVVRATTGGLGPGVQGKSSEGAGLRKKFATKKVNVIGFGFKKLYALAQCTPDLASRDCRRCLRIAIGELYGMVGAAGARVVQPSCCARYETTPFFNQTDDFSLLLQPKGSSKGRRSPGLSLKDQHTGRRKHFVLRISLFITCSVSITVLFGVSIWIYIRKLKADKTSNFEMNEIWNMDSLQFDLNTIRAATRNFAMDNKLGEGGFGKVYKGILEDGEEVAIKRLSKNSGQGIKEFKTEVVLVAKLQHKNLVRLLGFCLASTEKLLVYEFLQNSSLDQVLFDATKKEALHWEIRFKLIVGIARGLLYLHEDSRLKIVHRDLKPSNILLDEGMNPKISDFGLAKLFGGDQTQDDTKRIVGTYGYMAPEYAMTGHFSVKSDVYSFGIIVLEIVSGQRNRFFGRPQTEEALLHRAWRLWNDSKGLELVDIALGNNYPSEEVTKCIHIALLCIQENATERPRMATVVATLNGQSISIPMPKPPNFFGNNTTTTNDVDHNSQLGEYGREFMDQHGYPYVYSAAEMITEVYSRS